MEKEYITYQKEKGYPTGKNIYYECTLCNTNVNSLPETFSECKCGNIMIDVPMARLMINDKEHFKIFKFVKNKKIDIYNWNDLISYHDNEYEELYSNSFSELIEKNL